MCCGSAGRDRHPAVGHDHRTDHEAGPIRGDERDHFGDFFRLGGAADRRRFAMSGEKGRAVVDHVVEDVGHHIADTDSVDADAVANDLKRQGARQLGTRAFGRGVGGSPSGLFTRSLARALAVHLVRSYLDEGQPGRRVNALQAYKLRKVTDAMSAHLSAEFSLAKLASLAELSEYHFSRLFKRATGLSPSQYFIRLRMARARHLLLKTRLNVIDVGLEVGYSSPSHFSQIFRREVGVTPSEFRGA